MRRTLAVLVPGLLAVALTAGAVLSEEEAPADKADPPKVSKAALKRTRKTVQMLDEIYKSVIVLITDKYVHDETDFAAGSAAVLLFDQITKGGSHAVRLIDATGEPYDPENVAKDAFEKAGLKQIKAGKNLYEQVVEKEGQPYLRSMTPVPVVLERCIMCHPHYADAKKKGEPIGAISYTLPIE